MKSSRRRVLHLAALAAALPAVSRIAWAETYPSRPARIIVPLPAGGATGIFANLMGQWLTERLGQPFIIENHPGAGGNVGTEAVVKAAPDGYTLLLVGPPAPINTTLYQKLNYDFIRDIAPVATMVRQPLVMLVNPSLPAKTTREFIAYAKANPGKLNMASSGNATGTHLAGELFKMMAGVDMPHVGYRGAPPAFAAVIGGEAQVMFIGTAPAMEPIKAGKLRALAVTSATRSAVLPDITTIGDTVPGYEASAVYGFGAPSNTPAEIIDKLNREINAGLADPKIKARLASLGGAPLVGSPADFAKLIGDETEKWGKVIRAANIKPE